jgi:hypothetical protein
MKKLPCSLLYYVGVAKQIIPNSYSYSGLKWLGDHSSCLGDKFAQEILSGGGTNIWGGELSFYTGIRKKKSL